MPLDTASPFNGSRIVVTGGLGFIGSHLVKRLSGLGASEITIVDSMESGDSGRLTVTEKIRVVNATLGETSYSDLKAHLGKFDFLFHLAARKYQGRTEDTESLLRANILGTENIYRLAGEAGVKRVVFTSSLYAYGRVVGWPLSEDESATPFTFYGTTKQFGEQSLSLFAKRYGFGHNSLRLFFVYGPGQFPGFGYKSVIVSNFERLAQGLPPIVRGDGEQRLDYVFVDDVVDALLLSASSSEVGHILNVGSGTAVSINDLLNRMQTIAGTKFTAHKEPADWTHGTNREANIHRIGRALGWAPRVSLDQGLTKTLEWYRSWSTAIGSVRTQAPITAVAA